MSIRIGLLGASRIARGAVIAPASEIDGVEVTRVAASSVDKAQAYADEHGIPGVEADYAALVASDAVDLVYNALPPSGHMQWSIAALEHGKHVLCEKPFAMNADEAVQMVAAADKSPGLLIEAFHHRFHPLFDRVLEIVNSGTLGDVQRLRSHFNVTIPYVPGELRHTLEVGGGALMDLGCYPVHWVRTVMGTEPAVVLAEAVQEREGVDSTMRATLDFDGVPAEIECSMAEGLPDGHRAALVVDGASGKLAVINPLSPHTGHELILSVDGETMSETVDGNSTYWHQLRHFVDVIHGNAEPISGGEDAVANMRAIDAIYRSAGMLPRGKSS
ncbi:MAG: Gfo/Idh/MocA family oxidoreductase [Woeseiaceae bacterium]|nr:Gfo/Idh/MocA family oxidoreductase [Woeseiaceae bacterium]